MNINDITRAKCSSYNLVRLSSTTLIGFTARREEGKEKKEITHVYELTFLIQIKSNYVKHF